jgi:hypothetical protein
MGYPLDRILPPILNFVLRKCRSGGAAWIAHGSREAPKIIPLLDFEHAVSRLTPSAGASLVPWKFITKYFDLTL